jgi:hypothetical protein
MMSRDLTRYSAFFMQVSTVYFRKNLGEERLLAVVCMFARVLSKNVCISNMLTFLWF